ncbi:hypothetical protein FB451DRAFT_766054 [Mycena latifolia]|nr:hypothetical protein FB451DRAFT_766054 [Mycena latifolia]
MTIDADHVIRMKAAQNVFKAKPSTVCRTDPKSDTMTAPIVVPSEVILDNFWRRVAELTTRYHDVQNKWIGGSEIRQWNAENRTACGKCLNSKTGRECVIDEDHPSCRACRANKIGCDRKPRFVYDMTKCTFFPTYEQFISVFHNKEAGRLKRYIKVPRDPGKRVDRRLSRGEDEYVQEIEGCCISCGVKSNGQAKRDQKQEPYRDNVNKKEHVSMEELIRKLHELQRLIEANLGSDGLTHLYAVFGKELNRSGQSKVQA